MLDPTLTYSFAVFHEPDASLEQAQRHKPELVCQKLELGPTDRLLEIDTGWGSFALHAAASRGWHVTTTTISREQHDHVCALVRQAGLQDRITVLARDYRDLEGRYGIGARGRAHRPARSAAVLLHDGGHRAVPLRSRSGRFAALSGRAARRPGWRRVLTIWLATNEPLEPSPLRPELDPTWR